jgi:hypothetical protein
MATLGTQDPGRRKTKYNGNIGHTRPRTKKNQRQWQHWTHKTQDEDKPKTMATLDPPPKKNPKQNKKQTNKKTGNM